MSGYLAGHLAFPPKNGIIVQSMNVEVKMSPLDEIRFEMALLCGTIRMSFFRIIDSSVTGSIEFKCNNSKRTEIENVIRSIAIGAGLAGLHCNVFALIEGEVLYGSPLEQKMIAFIGSSNGSLLHSGLLADLLKQEDQKTVREDLVVTF